MRESERGGLFFSEKSVGEVFCLQLFAFVPQKARDGVQ